jgi:hypothetical protein
MNHPYPRSGRIVAAVFRRSVKGGAYGLTCPATVAFININCDRFYDFLLFLACHDYGLLRLIPALFMPTSFWKARFNYPSGFPAE